MSEQSDICLYRPSIKPGVSVMINQALYVLLMLSPMLFLFGGLAGVAAYITKRGG